VALQNADGSYNVRLDPPGSGLYTPEGYLRVETASAQPGVYAASGAYRVVVNDTGGRGLYHANGSLRVTTSAVPDDYNVPGLYAKDGSWKVTVNV
jgi:hypothetical protein